MFICLLVPLFGSDFEVAFEEDAVVFSDVGDGLRHRRLLSRRIRPRPGRPLMGTKRRETRMSGRNSPCILGIFFVLGLRFMGKRTYDVIQGGRFSFFRFISFPFFLLYHNTLVLVILGETFIFSPVLETQDFEIGIKATPL